MDPFPDVIRIEPVGACNFRCVHCPTGIDPNGRRILSDEQFHRILDQWAQRRFVPRVVVLYHGGEPLIHNRLEHFIETLKNLGVQKTVITTNASLLTEDRSEKLVSAGLDELKVSFDGESREENDSIRVKGDFLRDAGHVKAFLQIRRQRNSATPVVKICNVRVCDQPTLEAMAKQRSFVLPELPDYLKTFFADEMGELKWQSYPAMVWPGLHQHEDMAVESFPSHQPSYCDSLFETTTILSSGDVVACCFDLPGETVLGNVFERSIFDIWEGEAYTKFRNSFRERRYPAMCTKCRVVTPRYLCKTDVVQLQASVDA